VKIKPPFLGPKHEAASDALERAVNQHSHDYVSLGELMHALHERGFGLLMLVLVLPNCVPVPLPPGISTIFSLPLLFLSTQMLMGLDSPWLPGWLHKKKINRRTLAKIISRANPRLKKIEILLRPRLSFASTRTGEKLLGGFWLIFSISIAIPLPMTNFIPGVGILVSALGLLSKDGVVLLLGILIGLGGIVVTTMVIFLGAQAASALLDYAANFIGTMGN